MAGLYRALLQGGKREKMDRVMVFAIYFFISPLIYVCFLGLFVSKWFALFGVLQSIVLYVFMEKIETLLEAKKDE